MIGLIGISYKTSTVEVREKFAFTPEESILLMKKLKEKANLTGIILVATCNRTEIYYHSDAVSTSIVELLKKELFVFKGLEYADANNCFFQLEGEDCYTHLFKLTSGLDSMVLGESQILGQIKDAFRRSVENDCSSSILSRFFHKSFEAGKKVRNVYNISAVPLSAGSSAVDAAMPLFAVDNAVKVLIIGSGQMAESVLQRLEDYRPISVSIYNRTIERAEKLADRFNVIVVPDNELVKAIGQANLVFVATSALYPVVSPCMLTPDATNTRVFFDLAVPRNVDALVNSIEGNKVLTIDSLQNFASILENNKENIVLANELVQQLVAEFTTWLSSLQLSPTIDLLQQKFEEVLNLRLDFMEKKVSEREFELIAQTGKYMKDKYLRTIVASLKELSDNGAKPHYADMINHMIESVESRKQGS